MPIELPNLDDRTYDDLVQEALSLIPSYAPDWTNYNPSDPGITLIELFAYLSEMLIYRLNRVTDANQRMFLKLLNGENWVQTQDLQDEIRETILRLRSCDRAVTCEDYERLSTESFNNWLAETQKLHDLGRIQRAYCLAERNLETNVEEERKQPASGHVSVIIIILPSKNNFDPKKPEIQPSEEQCQALWNYLNDRRLLTTRHHVVGPVYVPVSAEIQVARRHDALDEKLRDEIMEKIANFLSPLPVAKTFKQKGWQFGRDVYISELYELLEQIEGIDYIPDIQLSSACLPESDRCVAAESIFNDEGDQIGLQLYDHHLPASHIDRQKIVIVGRESFQVVSLTIAVTSTVNGNIAELKQRIQVAVRDFLQPLRCQPDPKNLNPTRIGLVTQYDNKIIRRTRLEVISRDPIQYRDLDSQDLNLKSEIAEIQMVTAIGLATEIIIEPQQVIDLHLQIQVQGGENNGN